MGNKNLPVEILCIRDTDERRYGEFSFFLNSFYSGSGLLIKFSNIGSWGNKNLPVEVRCIMNTGDREVWRIGGIRTNLLPAEGRCVRLG